MDATVDAAQLRIALKACLPIMTKEDVRSYDNHLKVTLENTALVFEAVDGFRLLQRRVLAESCDPEAGTRGYMTRAHVQSLLPLIPAKGSFELHLEDDERVWPDTARIIPQKNGGIKLSVKYLKEAMQAFPDVIYVTIDMTDKMKPIRISPDERSDSDHADDVCVIMPAV
jgi:DNA polymerase III sliding clamp (beta) subunit (PCNA family)